MNVEELREYCLSKEAVTESFPFDEVTLVFKVHGKMFLLISLESEALCFSVKCDPERAVDLRERYSSVTAAYHMNKIHWNTICVDGTINDQLLYAWVDHSYELIISSLPKKRIKKTHQVN